MNVKLYKHKEWLKRKYVNEELSYKRIAKICNTGQATIWEWMRRFDITGRSYNEAIHLRSLRLVNHCCLSQKALEWINGELLGDGSIQSYSNYSAEIRYSSKYLEYIKYVRDTLTSFGIKQTGKIRKICSKKLNCWYYDYISLRYAELLSIRKQWYPEGQKIVPRDLKLTPLMCRQWFIGDGCLLHQQKYGRSCIMLCTNGFSISDVEWLVKKLNELEFKATRRPSDNAIHISVRSVQNFLNYIEPCPVTCYQYKWDYNKKKIKEEIKIGNE